MSSNFSLPNTGVKRPSFMSTSCRVQKDPACGRAGLRANVCPDPAAAMAFQYRVHQARRAVAVLEGSECRRKLAGHRPAVRNRAIHVSHHVAERVGPCLLMSPRQMRVRTRHRNEERRIFWQPRVRGFATSDPQIVLTFLKPAQRRASSVDLEPEVVLVTGADLTHRDAALRTAVEPHEDRGEIFALHFERLAASGGARCERLGGALRLEACRD